MYLTEDVKEIAAPDVTYAIKIYRPDGHSDEESDVLWESKTDTYSEDTETEDTETEDTETEDTETEDTETEDTETEDTETEDTETEDTETEDTETEDTETEDTGTEDTETDSGYPDIFHIEAECAIALYAGDCDGFIDGDRRMDLIDQDSGKLAPSCEGDCTTVGYMNPGAWISFPDIDFTIYDTLSMRIANKKVNPVIEFYIDSLAGTEIGSMSIYTGSYSVYDIGFISVAEVTGIHTLFVYSGDNGSSGLIGNGVIDWLELSVAK